ncbi:MAG: FAD-dependent oxidoreductase [Alphaproteobacteria bacterium]|nr:FAD-dependent oxidoreductase [Alphaproteobacteria bacterium]
MSTCRLPDTDEHRFGGRAIDRKATVEFTIDGVAMTGFAGDSVLSALMASGFCAFGTHLGHPVNLTANTPFYISPAGGDPLPALRATSIPIAPGMVLTSRGRIRGRGKLRWDFWKKNISLRSLNQPLERIGSDLAALPARQINAEVAVVGGGVAGLAAAIYAARAGRSTILLEREILPGGSTGFFARVDGEPDPATTVASLIDEAKSLENLEIITGAQVERVGKEYLAGTVINRANATVPVLERLEVSARFIVLAAGAEERLPLFSGNRLPGVAPAISTWRLAMDYGIWRGTRARFFLNSSTGYRLATLAADAGVEIDGIIDTRLDPQSRLIAFAKAYGMRMAFATTVTSVWQSEEQPQQICVQTGPTTNTPGTGTAISTTDCLIFAGGLQPNVRLWALSGGQVHWDNERAIIVAGHGPDWLAIAGSANNVRTLPAVIADGQRAVSTLLGDRQPRVLEVEIDTLFESEDGPLPASVPVPADAVPGYFDGAGAMATLPQTIEKRRILDRVLWHHEQTETETPQFQPPTIVEVAARTTLGEIAPEEVQTVATERVIEVRQLRQMAEEGHDDNQDGPELAPRMAPDLAPTAPTGPAAIPQNLPPWLFGRYGRTPQQVRLITDDGRRLEPGRLVFANSEDTEPEAAIGVVTTELDGAALAIFSRSFDLSVRVSVADAGGRTAASLMALPSDQN